MVSRKPECMSSACIIHLKYDSHRLSPRISKDKQLHILQDFFVKKLVDFKAFLKSVGT